MKEFFTSAPFAHYPRNSQFRSADYYPGMFNVTVGIIVENYISSEDVLFTDLSITVSIRIL